MSTKLYYIREFNNIDRLTGKRVHKNHNPATQLTQCFDSIDELFAGIQTPNPYFMDSVLNARACVSDFFDVSTRIFVLHVDFVETEGKVSTHKTTDTVFLVHHLGLEMVHSGHVDSPSKRGYFKFSRLHQIYAHNKYTKEVMDSTPTFLYMVRSVEDEVKHVKAQPNYLFVNPGKEVSAESREDDFESCWNQVLRSFLTASWALFRDLEWFGWGSGQPPIAFNLPPMSRIGFGEFMKVARSTLDIPNGGYLKNKEAQRLEPLTAVPFFAAPFYRQDMVRTVGHQEICEKYEVFDKFARIDTVLGSVAAHDVVCSGSVEVEDGWNITSAFRHTVMNTTSNSFGAPHTLVPIYIYEFKHYYGFANNLQGLKELKLELLKKLITISRGQDKDHHSDDVVERVYGAELCAFTTTTYPEKDVFVVSQIHPDKARIGKLEIPTFRSGQCYFEKLFIQSFRSNEDIASEDMAMYLANYVEMLDLCVATSIIYTVYRTLALLNAVLKEERSDPIKFDITRNVIENMGDRLYDTNTGQFVIDKCEAPFKVCSVKIGWVTITVHTKRLGLENEFFISVIGGMRSYDMSLWSIGVIKFSKVGHMINGETHVLTYTDVIAVSMVILEVVKDFIPMLGDNYDDVGQKFANHAIKYLNKIFEFDNVSLTSNRWINEHD